MTVAQGEQLVSRDEPILPGRYGAYYAAVRDAVHGTAPNPVPPDEALAVMTLIELGLASAEQRRELPTPPRSGVEGG